MSDKPSAENPAGCEKSVSGIIEGPAGYNGTRPSSIKIVTKDYPGSSKLGQGKGGSGMIEGPRSKK